MFGSQILRLIKQWHPGPLDPLTGLREATFRSRLLAKHLALSAANHLPSWEILEYAKADKVDAQAARVNLQKPLGEVAQSKMVRLDQTHGEREARRAAIGGTQVHSIRLPGFAIAIETLFGLPYERLTIRHDAGASPEPLRHGALLAVRRVLQLTGLAWRCGECCS